MKILMVADVQPDPDSGAAGTEYQTMRALRVMGHAVDTLWFSDLRHRIHHGNLHGLFELPWAYRDAIRLHADAKNYDAIHVNQPYAWLAAMDHQRSGRPGVFVNRSHGWEPRIYEALRPWHKKFRVREWRFPRGVLGRPMRCLVHQYARRVVKWSNGVIVSCSEDRDYILKHYPLSADRVSNIPQAAISLFSDTPPQPMTTDRVRRVLYVGQSAFFKGPQLLAAVFSRLAERDPSLVFTWCTDSKDHVFCRSLLSPTARDRVNFRDWMSQADLIHCYDQHGVFVFTTLAEGFGKVFIEAMARGLCVVASNTAGMRDIIRCGESGWLVEPGDVDGFCRGVEAIIGSDRADAMSRAAAAAARTYSWRRVAIETADFYRHLLAYKRDSNRSIQDAGRR